jgi:hypothetical protein
VVLARRVDERSSVALPALFRGRIERTDRGAVERRKRVRGECNGLLVDDPKHGANITAASEEALDAQFRFLPDRAMTFDLEVKGSEPVDEKRSMALACVDERALDVSRALQLVCADRQDAFASTHLHRDPERSRPAFDESFSLT